MKDVGNVVDFKMYKEHWSMYYIIEGVNYFNILELKGCLKAMSALGSLDTKI